MTYKDARKLIEEGKDKQAIHDQFIEESVAKVNYKGIAFENVRKKVEQKYIRLKAELDWCYYVFWKYGESCPFQGVDVQGTQKASFELFTSLCDQVDAMMAIENYEENEKTKEYPKLKEMMGTSDDSVSQIDQARAKLSKTQNRIIIESMEFDK